MIVDKNFMKTVLFFLKELFYTLEKILNNTVYVYCKFDFNIIISCLPSKEESFVMRL